MAKDLLDYQLDVLRDEIGTIHTRIGTFDTLSFQVKGWAATLWAGLVGYAVDKGNPVGVALSIPLMCVFWTLDAFFKSYQQRVRARMGFIERFLNRPPEKPEPSLRKACADGSFGSFVIHDPMFNQTFDKGDAKLKEDFSRKVGILRALRTSNVFLMYVALILSSLLVILYLILKPPNKPLQQTGAAVSLSRGLEVQPAAPAAELARYCAKRSLAYLRGASPRRVRANHPPVSSVAPAAERPNGKGDYEEREQGR